MIHKRKSKLLIAISLTVVLVLTSFSPRIFAGSLDPASKAQEKLQGISDEEKQVLQKLFVLSKEIEQMELEGKGLTGDIDALNQEIKGLEANIAEEEKAFNDKRDVLKEVLAAYQRKGPGSYIEILLDSENLNMFLWRLGTLQDLSRNTGDLLASMEESNKKLLDKKEGLNEKMVLLQDKQKQLNESLDKAKQLKEENEKYLASLNQDRGYYLEQLNNFQQQWDSLKKSFSQIADEFYNTVRNGSLPMDAVKISFSFSGIEAAIDEKAFNGILAGNPRLSGMAVTFHKGAVEIRVPDKNLVLTGTFKILEGNILQFAAQGGSFYGISLEPATVNELFKEGSLKLDLNSLVGKYKLDSVEISEGSLIFNVKLF